MMLVSKQQGDRDCFKSSPRDLVMRINASPKGTKHIGHIGFEPGTSGYETTALPLTDCVLYLYVNALIPVA